MTLDNKQILKKHAKYKSIPFLASKNVIYCEQNIFKTKNHLKNIISKKNETKIKKKIYFKEKKSWMSDETVRQKLYTQK